MPFVAFFIKNNFFEIFKMEDFGRNFDLTIFCQSKHHLVNFLEFFSSKCLEINLWSQIFVLELQSNVHIDYKQEIRKNTHILDWNLSPNMQLRAKKFLEKILLLSIYLIFRTRTLSKTLKKFRITLVFTKLS